MASVKVLLGIELFIDGNLPLISSDSAVVSQVILKDHP